MQNQISLRDVEEGMKVFDRDRHEIGRVETVTFGDDDPSTPEVEAAGPSGTPEQDGGLLGNIADVFHPDDMPEAVRARLMQQGFVRLDAAGLFAADRYITPDQIGGVTTDGLILNVTKDELLKRH